MALVTVQKLPQIKDRRTASACQNNWHGRGRRSFPACYAQEGSACALACWFRRPRRNNLLSRELGLRLAKAVGVASTRGRMRSPISRLTGASAIRL
jgi:hypothetical protein